VRLLVVNTGSATVKTQLFETSESGVVPGARTSADVGLLGHGGAVLRAISDLDGHPDAVVHRAVLAAQPYDRPVIIDERVMEAIRQASPLAPLHNPAAIEGIEATRAMGRPMLAAFDTSFHATLPPRAWRYALPASTIEQPVPLRRWGFHGWSHRSVVERYAELTGQSEPTIVTLHLGGGASAAAILQGRCVDTSMGATPLEGLVMGSRAGDVDPGILLQLLRTGTTVQELEEILNRRSGLVALAGTSDFREILRRLPEPDAELAVELFCYRALKYVGGYFTGAIGENSHEVQRRICAGLAWAGLRLRGDRLPGPEGRISTNDSRLHAWVIPSREELAIARASVPVLQGRAP